MFSALLHDTGGEAHDLATCVAYLSCLQDSIVVLQVGKVVLQDHFAVLQDNFAVLQDSRVVLQNSEVVMQDILCMACNTNARQEMGGPPLSLRGIPHTLLDF